MPPASLSQNGDGNIPLSFRSDACSGHSSRPPSFLRGRSFLCLRFVPNHQHKQSVFSFSTPPPFQARCGTCFHCAHLLRYCMSLRGGLHVFLALFLGATFGRLGLCSYLGRLFRAPDATPPNDRYAYIFLYFCQSGEQNRIPHTFCNPQCGAPKRRLLPKGALRN